MKDLLDELDVIAHLASCDCEESRPSVELLKNICLLQFLMGLNERYGNIQSNVLAKRPVITVNDAYAIVTQEESQRTLGVTDTLKDPLTMLAGKGYEYKPKRIGLICDHCGYKGQLKENCYKIVGYPPDFKSKKKEQNSRGKTYVNSATSEEKQVPMLPTQGNFFTEKQYKQLVNLLQKTTTDECSTNTAGIFTLMSNAGVSDQVWIVDSGVTHHVTHCKNSLNNLRKAYHRADGVQLPTGSRTEIKHTRDVVVLGNKTIEGGLYNDKVMGNGRENNGLYLITENFPTAVISFLKEHGETTLWHLRLGHASTKAMQHISELKNKKQTGRENNCEEQSFPFEKDADSDCTEDLFASQPPVVEETKHQPQAPIITTPPQNIQVPANANGTIEVETNDMDLVTDHAECSDNHETSDNLDSATVHAESDMHHEIPADASANENPFPIILEPEVETSIEEAGSEDVHSHPPSIEGQPRKSNRQEKGRPPVWLKDYITKAKTHINTAHSISNVLSYDHISPTYQSFLNVFSVLTEPQSFKEAAHDPRWIQAMDQEIRALEENHTWEVVDLPEGKKPIGSKWMFRIKYKSYGEIDKFKARLVDKGYTQQEGLDIMRLFHQLPKW
uniref:Reverse transcriptase Ty1/copia-type domain-containing protein n=1 Tax=Nicotiana tabacum TaxID=4097 RepID=A0A1S4ASA7_TOBAC|nr:PREDICTED: uncharacterized protein LOC107800758 [Nicotiana tabacum]